MTTAAPLVGHRLGDFQVLRKLGRGGMADVYVARQVSLGRDVALKVMRNDISQSEEAIARFNREARAAAKLNHPNIVQVFDVGRIDSTHYIAQELVDGEDLRAILDREGPISIELAYEILESVAAALDAAAEVGIIHRDIKPDNLMRSVRGAIKVTDFGLARVSLAAPGASAMELTQAGLTLGTPRYMSPEQIQGKPVDTRTDLYSLGVTLYHLLAGRPPFEADEPLALAVMHLQETPTPLAEARREAGLKDWIPDDLRSTIERLMRKDPDERFSHPGELMAASGANGGPRSMTSSAMLATARLQDATDRARVERLARIRRVAVATIVPLLITAAALMWVLRPVEVKILPGLASTEVERRDNVRQQYLTAIARNDEAGWRAVMDYFAADGGAVTADYDAKARLQLIRLLIAEGRLDDAEAEIAALEAKPEVDRFYLAISLVRQSELFEQRGDRERLAEVRQRLKRVFDNLTAENRKLFRDVVPEPQRLALGLE